MFEGGDTNIERKIKKFQQSFFDFDKNRNFVPPIFLRDATTQIVDEMEIDLAFCATETKDDCVALALKLNCPIVSFDIEYCFREAPYIISSTMKFHNRTNSIHCRQYKLQDFLRKHSLSEEKYAIFASLTDFTLFPFEFFDSLLEAWGVSTNSQFMKFKQLFLWLSKHSNQEVRNEISKNLPKAEDRNTFWENYNKVLTKMRKVEGGHVTEYLLNSTQQNIPIVRQDPEWFEKGVVCKHVPPIYINLYKYKVIDGSWAIDEMTKGSLSFSMDIIKYAYNLLTNYRGGTFRVYQNTDSYEEIDPDDGHVDRPTYECEVSVFENGWDHVKSLKLFEHFLNENSIFTEHLAELPADLTVLFIALLYFARRKLQMNAKQVMKEVYAVLISYVLQNFVFNKEKRTITSKEHLQVKNAIDTYYNYDKKEAKRIFDGEALKTFAEMQYCILHMNYLNTLCGSPYESTLYRTTYNGTLVYKLFCGMRDYKDGDDFINELFQRSPSVLRVVKNLIQVYTRNFNCLS